MLLEDIAVTSSSCVCRRTFDQDLLNKAKAFRIFHLGAQEGHRFRKSYILGRSLRVWEVKVYYT